MTTDTAAPPPAPTSGPRIDPRLRDRRIAVQREAGRRRLRLFTLMGIGVALVAGMVAVLFSPLLAVRRVTVDGVVYADPAAVAEAVATVEGDPLLTADLGALEERLEAIPWVKRVEADKDWFDRTVRVGIVERRPVAAYYADDGRYHVVDPDGVVIVALDGQPVDLVGIGLPGGVGPAAAPGTPAPGAVAATAAVANALPPELRVRTAELVVAEDGSVSLRLVPRGVVLLGPPNDLRAKLVAVLTVLADVDPDTLETLDVRVPNAPVLTGGDG